MNLLSGGVSTLTELHQDWIRARLFCSTSQEHLLSYHRLVSLWQHQQSIQMTTVSWGLIGSMKKIPQDFRYSTILFYGDKGARQVRQPATKKLS